MDRQEIKQILPEHKKWLNGGGGSRADLSGADLRDADLRGADLRDADLSRADLSGADLSRADLSGADLSRAVLRGAVLSRADLRGADLSRADLSRADLRDAVLRDAVLRDADLRGADLSGADGLAFQIPQEGELIIWKAVKGGIAKLKIPADAKRTGCLVSRKCRAEWVETLAIYKNGAEVERANGWHDPATVYEVGAVTRPDSYDDDIRVDCTHGIHFFTSKEEALAW